MCHIFLWLVSELHQRKTVSSCRLQPIDEALISFLFEYLSGGKSEDDLFQLVIMCVYLLF